MAKSTGFKLESNLPVPPRPRGGRGDGTTYPFGDMKAGQSFLVPVEVPATITDEGERNAAFKENARKVMSRVSGAIRRYKQDNPKANFTVRSVSDDKLGYGVRCWRVEDAAS